MSNISETPAAEPEELLEASIVALLAASCTIPVEGMVAPATEGTAKHLTADTFVGVKVDQASQDGDYTHRAPMTYAATVTVHYALADDADGSGFRDECRRVRAALSALCGDGCSAVDVANAFECNEFMLDSTSTDFVNGDNPTNTKAYTATVKGRTIHTTNTNTEAE